MPCIQNLFYRHVFLNYSRLNIVKHRFSDEQSMLYAQLASCFAKKNCINFRTSYLNGSKICYDYILPQRNKTSMRNCINISYVLFNLGFILIYMFILYKYSYLFVSEGIISIIWYSVKFFLVVLLQYFLPKVT